MVWSPLRVTALPGLFGLLGLVLATTLATRHAAAQDAALLEGFLDTLVNERGQHCTKLASQRQGERLFVACGKGGLWEIAVPAGAPPVFVKSYDLGGEVTGLFQDDSGQTWVKLQVVHARPLDAVLSDRGQPASSTAVGALPPIAEQRPPAAAPAPAAAVPPAPSKPPSASWRVGRVIAVDRGDVVISLGRADGVGLSDRVAFSLDAADDPLAVGVVINVDEHRAKVRLGLNEEVPLGAIASPTRASKTESLSAPPRVSGFWDIAFMARPFAALGELGGGVLLSASAGRYFDGHLHLQALFDPLALADAQESRGVSAVNAALMVSYDSLYFEMGAGLGAQTVNNVSFVIEPGSGLAVAQLVRLGPLDGLNLMARTSIVLFHSEFNFGGMVVTSQIPVTRGYWLLLGGGGGDVGYGYGEFGLRVLTSGSGGRGSTFLSTTAGGATVFESGVCTTEEFSFECEPSVSYAGPMVGVGWEWRL